MSADWRFYKAVKTTYAICAARLVRDSSHKQFARDGNTNRYVSSPGTIVIAKNGNDAANFDSAKPVRTLTSTNKRRELTERSKYN